MPEVALLKLVQEGRAAHGRRDSLWVFDTDSFVVRKLYCTFEDARDQGEGIELEVRLYWEDALFPEAEILTWIDRQGREVRSQMSALNRARAPGRSLEKPAESVWIIRSKNPADSKSWYWNCPLDLERRSAC